MSKNFYPYGKQEISEQDIAEVVRVLNSDYLTQGPEVESFEKEIANLIGAKHAVSVSSGTAALHLAFAAMGLQKGDAVFVPAITFAATSNAALYCGATPVFVDISPKTYCLSERSLESAYALAIKSGLKPKVVAPVHYAGFPCLSKELVDFCDHKNLRILEDACHALGAEYRLSANEAFKKIGACEKTATILSFHPVKHITTGEGGAIVTSDTTLYSKLTALRSHGITKNSYDFIHKEESISPNNGMPNVWYHEMQALGFNYRLPDILAVLGRSQLRKINKNISNRRELAAYYRTELNMISCVALPPEDNEHSKHSYHLFPLQIDFRKLGKERNQVMLELKEQGVGTQVHYIPVYRHPYYENNKQAWIKTETPFAEEFYLKELSIPMYPSLFTEGKERISMVLRKVLAR